MYRCGTPHPACRKRAHPHPPASLRSARAFQSRANRSALSSGGQPRAPSPPYYPARRHVSRAVDRRAQSTLPPPARTKDRQHAATHDPQTPGCKLARHEHHAKDQSARRAISPALRRSSTPSAHCSFFQSPQQSDSSCPSIINVDYLTKNSPTPSAESHPPRGGGTLSDPERLINARNQLGERFLFQHTRVPLSRTLQKSPVKSRLPPKLSLDATEQPSQNGHRAGPLNPPPGHPKSRPLPRGLFPQSQSPDDGGY